MIRSFSLLLAALSLLPGAVAPAAAATKVAVFAFEMADPGAITDPTGTISAGAYQLQQSGTPADVTRLALVTDALRNFLKSDPALILSDTSPLEKKIADASPLHKCNGCEADLAKEMGADLSVLGKVTKLTPVLIHFDISVRNATSGNEVRAVSVEINGDTDEMWIRGVRWLYKNRLADPPLGTP